MRNLDETACINLLAAVCERAHDDVAAIKPDTTVSPSKWPKIQQDAREFLSWAQVHLAHPRGTNIEDLRPSPRGHIDDGRERS
jgi:hypothetical protein